jgi:cytochrome c oxidase subunit 2
MTSLLLYLVVILGILAFVQLIRVLELTNKLKGSHEVEVSDSTNKKQGRNLMIFLFGYLAFFLWLYIDNRTKMLPESASEHGVSIDFLLDFNFVIILIPFIITHILLFYFAYKYAGKKDGKATYVTDNHKLELIWTSVPAVVLAIIIIYGISTWNSITRDTPEDPLVIELYSKQFDWTARYTGPDGKLGDANYLFISGTNPLGLITKQTIEDRLSELNAKIAELEDMRATEYQGGKRDENLQRQIARYQGQLTKINNYKNQIGQKQFSEANDDVLTKVEFHIPVNKDVLFFIRSQDVIHSAYMPHFRQQMNAVPGMVTQMYFKPIITTEEMRIKTGNPDFKYLLYCNKICGAAHYNMQMEIIVESEEQYNNWLKEQKTFSGVQVSEILKSIEIENQMAIN